MRKVKYKGNIYKISSSQRKGKQLRVTSLSLKRPVHFGDPSMKEFPGTKRGDNYCARSFGIGNTKNPSSANFWSRKYLWNCVKKKSKKSLKGTGLRSKK